MKKKKELIDRNNVFLTDLSKVRQYKIFIIQSMSGCVFLQLENQKQQVEAKLRERRMIDEKNCDRCVAEIERAASLLTATRLRLTRRISLLDQLGEIDLESQDEKELEQITRHYQSWELT